MAKQFERKEDFEEAMLKLTELLAVHFGLTDPEIDAVVYTPLKNISVEDRLDHLCGSPDYSNYN